ncbi:glycoside hydrolase family 16 protein [Salinibacterium sp. G-O1]|uniref:glycoside hydrolase family 16 protein n=1 Tax=Salinibacterium sp. G-O1 TaxID=3046208 RepID=UPI0024BA810C|nr:glycoside hydrolase family 16 protein [Salinibacterium sp. G-O1]MDJ0336090.1 glycoside hydrolase family 16 protein [Salinibacterium sp. G-O1]
MERSTTVKKLGNLRRPVSGALAVALAFGALTVAGVETAPSATAAAPSGYSQIWADEFSGTALDTTKWNTNWPDVLPGGQFGVDKTAYNSSYVSVHDGYAWLKVDDTATTINGVTFPYQTGFLSTKDKFEAKYGYAEIRLRHASAPTTSASVHTGMGSYHSFWMDPHYNDSSSTTAGSPSFSGLDVNGANGRGTEVDITEWGGQKNASGQDIVNLSNIWGGYGSGFHSDTTQPAVTNPQDWHTYGLEWTPTKLVWYQDGVALKTIQRGGATPIPFYPEFLMVQAGVVNWQAAVTNVPDYLQVDYVRYSQLPNVTYQFEDGALAGNAQVNNNHAGFTGTGFVDNFASNSSASAAVSIDSGTTSTKSVTIRYSAGPLAGTPTNRVLGLYLNGVKLRDVTFSGTANWDTWANQVENISFPGGYNNQVTLKGERSDYSDGVNLDSITLANDTDVVSGNYVVNPQFSDTVKSFGTYTPAIPAAAPSGWNTWSPSGAYDSASFIQYDTSDYANLWGGAHWSASPYQVYTGQTINIPNGTYTLSAWVRSSGGQAQAYLEAKDYGAVSQKNITATSTWTRISITFTATTGLVNVGFYSNASGNQWIGFDNVQLLRQ